MMKKRNTVTTVLSVSVAIIVVAIAAYMTGTKNTGPKSPEPLSSTFTAERLTKGMIAYFNLDKNEYENLFHFYKAYEDLRIPYEEKLRVEQEGKKEVTSKEMWDYINSITEAKAKLEAGVKAILTEEQYKEWRKKERRSRVSYK